MSVVLVQVGQCGNQVGQCFLNTVSEGTLNIVDVDRWSKQYQMYSETMTERFFTRTKNESLKARAVLVDTEHKVIERLFEPKKKRVWHYSRKNSVELSGGSGNLWSRGYCKNGPMLSEKTVDIVQSELEKCDTVGGLLLMMSAAGGTGSGVGAHLTKVFRDSFPRMFIANQFVWPYSSGEVVIQSYNAVLTLSHLLPYTDAVINFHNDELHNICSRCNNSFNINDMNHVLAAQLASILCPASDDRNHVTRLGDLIEQLTSHSAYKMISVKSVPHNSVLAKEFTTDTWTGLTKLLTREVGRRFVSLSDLAIIRGNDAKSADLSEFVNRQSYASLIPSQATYKVWHEDALISKNITLATNNAGIVSTLESTLQRAWRLLSNGAYLHHLARHGISQPQVADSMASVEQVSKNYKLLS